MKLHSHTSAFRLLTVAVLAIFVTAVGRAAETTPEALVAELYGQHEKKSPFFQTDDRAVLDHYFARCLAEEIWKDAKEAQGEVRALGADPLYDSQDPDPKDFTIHPAKITGDTSSVEVTFLEGAKKIHFLFILVETKAGWRIEDIRYEKGRSLLGILKAYEN